MLLPVAVFLLAPNQASLAKDPPGWGQFRKCEGTLLRLMPAAESNGYHNTAAFKLAQKDGRKQHVFDAYLTVDSDDVVYFTPEHRPKRKGTFADLRPGMKVVVSGIVSTNGSPATEILILDAPNP